MACLRSPYAWSTFGWRGKSRTTVSRTTREGSEHIPHEACVQACAPLAPPQQTAPLHLHLLLLHGERHRCELTWDAHDHRMRMMHVPPTLRDSQGSRGFPPSAGAASSSCSAAAGVFARVDLRRVERVSAAAAADAGSSSGSTEVRRVLMRRRVEGVSCSMSAASTAPVSRVLGVRERQLCAGCCTWREQVAACRFATEREAVVAACCVQTLQDSFRHRPDPVTRAAARVRPKGHCRCRT